MAAVAPGKRFHPYRPLRAMLSARSAPTVQISEHLPRSSAAPHCPVTQATAERPHSSPHHPGGDGRQRAELRRPATSRPVTTRTLDRRDARHEAMDTMAVRDRSTRRGVRRGELDCAGHPAAQLDTHHRGGLDPGGHSCGLARHATPPAPVPAPPDRVTARLAAFVPATINGELHTGWSRLGRAARDIWIVPDRGRAADGPEAAGAGVADRGTRNQQIASKPAAALETVNNMTATSWASSAPPTAPRP